MKIRTTDLCDQFFADLQIAEPLFRDYGGKLDFAGPIVTVQQYEDNVIVRKILEEPGNGRVLVVDGGGSLRRAIIGDIIAAIAHKNDWAGVLINGCIRDVTKLATIPMGIKALMSWLGLASAAGIFAGIFEPLGFGIAGAINAMSYILWAIWLIAMGVALLRPAHQSANVKRSARPGFG
jgi:regulator of ribonuclease activity A